MATLKGDQEVWFLSENGVYEVLMQSRKGGYLYAEQILQQLQLWLMKNQANEEPGYSKRVAFLVLNYLIKSIILLKNKNKK